MKPKRERNPFCLLQIKVPRNLRDVFKADCALHEISMNEQVVNLVRQHLKKRAGQSTTNGGKE